MQVTVLYFARLREALGLGREQVDAPEGVRTMGQLRDWLVARGEPWSGAFAQVAPLRMAMDQEMVGADALLRAGAEVAFFPPVTGG